MSAPRPILFVHHRPELGGAPASLAYLIQTLDRARFEPHVYCPEGPVNEFFRQAGATVHVGPVATLTHIWASTYRGRRWLLLGRELVRLPGHVVQFRRALGKRPFALVHLNDSPLLPAAWLARNAGIPVIWHLRSALPEQRGLRRRFLCWAVRRLASASIAINDDVDASFGAGSTVIPNGVDLKRFAPGDAEGAKPELGLEPGRPIVSFFGFVYPLKGYREFIEAAGVLRSTGVEATYLIVGGAVRGEYFFRTAVGRLLRTIGLAADYEADAREIVERLGLSTHVRFLPFATDPARIYIASDVIVAPSRGPELGRPVIEAAACGRAVIASGSLSGAGLVLPDRTGIIVPRRSPDALAAAIGRLLGDDDLRHEMGRRARLHAESNFDVARNARATVTVYERVLAGA